MKFSLNPSPYLTLLTFDIALILTGPSFSLKLGQPQIILGFIGGMKRRNMPIPLLNLSITKYSSKAAINHVNLNKDSIILISIFLSKIQSKYSIVTTFVHLFYNSDFIYTVIIS